MYANTGLDSFQISFQQKQARLAYCTHGVLGCVTHTTLTLPVALADSQHCKRPSEDDTDFDTMQASVDSEICDFDRDTLDQKTKNPQMVDRNEECNNKRFNKT